MNGYAYTILVEAEKSIRAVVNCNERGCRDCWAELQAALQSISQAKQTLNRAEVKMTKVAMEERMRGPKDPAMTESETGLHWLEKQVLAKPDETKDHLHVVDSMVENTFKKDDPDDEALDRIEIRRKADKAENDARNMDDLELPPEEVEENLMEQAEYDRERLRLDGMENPDDPENG